MGEEGDTLFVWGTNLTINGITKRVRAFYKGFRANDDDAMPKYEEMLREVRSQPILISSIDSGVACLLRVQGVAQPCHMAPFFASCLLGTQCRATLMLSLGIQVQ